MAELIQITDNNYEKEIHQSNDIWCVTFSALSFCQPCKMLHPVIQSIAKNNKVPGVKFGVVATEDSGLNFSTMMNVRGVPTSHVMKGNKILGTKVGFVEESKFIEFVKTTVEESNKS